MKKFISSLLAATLCCSTLTGCGVGNLSDLSQLFSKPSFETEEHALQLAQDVTDANNTQTAADNNEAASPEQASETEVIPEEPAGPQPGVILDNKTRGDKKTAGTSNASGTGNTSVQQSGKYSVEQIANALDDKGYKLTISNESYTQIVAVDASTDIDKFYMITERTVPGGKNQAALYVIGQEMYCYAGANDQKYAMYHITGDSASEMASQSTFSENEYFPNKDNIISVKELGQKEYQGVQYDTVEVATKSEHYDEYSEALEDGITGTVTINGETQSLVDSYQQNMQNTAVYYFNASTQKLEYIQAQQDGQDMMIHIEPFEAVTEQPWFAQCNEASDEEAMGIMFLIIFLPTSDELLTPDSF